MIERQLTKDLLRAYVAKTLVDEELILRIDQERSVAGSWVQRAVEEMYEKLGDPLNVDWYHVASTDDERSDDDLARRAQTATVDSVVEASEVELATDAPKELPTGALAWLSVSWSLPESHETQVERAAAQWLRRLQDERGLKAAAGFRSQPSDGSVDASVAEFEALLSTGQDVTLRSSGCWIRVTMSGNEAVVMAGKSPALRFKDFQLQMVRGGLNVLTIDSRDGTVRITREHVEFARLQRVDSLAVVVKEERE